VHLWYADRLEGRFDTKLQAIEIPKDEHGVSITLPLAPDLRFPGPLVSLEKIDYRYTPKGPVVLQDLSLSIHMGDRIAIIGLNGGGKSTLIKIITDTVRPTRGLVTRHPRLKLRYYSQHAVEDLQDLGRADPTKTALGLLAADTAGAMNEQEMRGLLGSFGLPGRTASDVPIGKLSGGQLVRPRPSTPIIRCRLLTDFLAGPSRPRAHSLEPPKPPRPGRSDDAPRLPHCLGADRRPVGLQRRDRARLSRPVFSAAGDRGGEGGGCGGGRGEGEGGGAGGFQARRVCAEGRGAETADEGDCGV